jgi:hypothetical protein
MNLAFPDVKSFDELFVADRTFTFPHDAGKGHPSTGPQPFYMIEPREDPRAKTAKFVVPVGPYCVFKSKDGSYGSIYVMARKELEEYVRANMIRIEHDSLYYEIIEYDDGTALILVQYNQILGNRWLAIVDAKTLWRPGVAKCVVCGGYAPHGEFNYLSGDYYHQGACYDTLFLPCLKCGQKNMTAKSNLENGCCGNEQLCDTCYNKKHNLSVVTLGFGPFRR